MKRFLTLVHDFVVGKPLRLRSSRWESVRKRFLTEHPTCAACNGTVGLQVHHIKPFHLHPELELDTSNLIVLCETINVECHLDVGHHGDWKLENPDVVQDAARMLAYTH